MIVIHNQAHMLQLGIAVSFTLALPDTAADHPATFPCVLCLHDSSQNGEQLLQALYCAALVDENQTALLLPDGQNGCFCNMAHGPQWETYLMEGLLPYAGRTFPLGLPPRLFGVGTGGWAAARLAARYPQRFGASAAVNAMQGLPAAYAQGKLAAIPELAAVFGDPQAMPLYPLCGQTRWFQGTTAAEALQTLANEDWRTPV